MKPIAISFTKHPRTFALKDQKNQPENHVWLKNGKSLETAELALVITHPFFQYGNQTRENITDWFKANVDQSKTPKEVQRHFLKLAYKNIDRLYTKKGRLKATNIHPMQWRVSMKSKAWKARIDAILDLGA